MTNPEKAGPAGRVEFGHWVLGIGYWSLIRHSGFLIRHSTGG
jgi:hypothetical protein